MFQVGDQVRVKGTDDVGVVLGSEGDVVQVQFAVGRRSLNAADLIAAGGDPLARLASGEVSDPDRYGLRLQAEYLRHAYRYDPLSGLSNARIEPKLHQIFVAHRVFEKVFPRMILADEVGLGKTIEAGLVIKELRARQLIERVLVVCPASLQFQWQTELRSKFNEEFEIIDGAAAKFLGRGGVNPFGRKGGVICSLTFAAREERAAEIVEAGWDLVIFDEAHRVRRWRQGAKSVKTTKAYELAERLRDNVAGMLMLSATPMQLHPFELYSLIELVEPGLFKTFEHYNMQRRELPRLNSLMRGLKEWPLYDGAARRDFLDTYHWAIQELGVEPGSEEKALDEPSSRVDFMNEVAARHPLASVLVRNRKAEIGGFTKRVAEVVEVQLTEDELELYRDMTEYIRLGYNRARAEKNQAVGFLMVLYQKILASSSNALRASLRRRLAKLQDHLEFIASLEQDGGRVALRMLEELLEGEEVSAALDELEQISLDRDGLEWEIEVLRGLVDRLGRIRDSKAAAMLKRIDAIDLRVEGEKVLLFTQFIDTQKFLAFTLQRQGYEVAQFNGRMSLDEKERQVRQFRDDAQIMITTEAGGEGRNFQFAHILFNYDLPWNPMKVEQRIGRLDRIGQSKPVLIYNLVCLETVEERVLDVLDRRIGLFEESVGSLEPILGDVEGDITRLVVSDPDKLAVEMTRYAEDLEQKVRGARLKAEVMADFALDHSSFRRDEANRLLGERPLATADDLRAHCTESLRYFGGSLDKHPEAGDSLGFSPQLARKIPGSINPVRGVFDPEEALRHEELDFLAFGHPVVDAIIDLALETDGGIAGARHDPELPSGVYLEVFYEFEARGARPFGRMTRHVVGSDLVVSSQPVRRLPIFSPQPAPGSPEWLSEAFLRTGETFANEHAQFRAEAHKALESEKEEALKRLRRIYDYRRAHLQALVARDEEWIHRAEETGSDDDKRILPAIRGRMAKQQRQIAELDSDQGHGEAEVKGREVRASGRTIAAGLVVGG